MEIKMLLFCFLDRFVLFFFSEETCVPVSNINLLTHSSQSSKVSVSNSNRAKEKKKDI